MTKDVQTNCESTTLIETFDVLHGQHLRFTQLLEFFQQEADNFFSGEMDKILNHFHHNETKKCEITDTLLDTNLTVKEKYQRIEKIKMVG